jgi:hypothetical protein
MLTGLFSQAFFSPFRIFPLSKTSLLPSFLTTRGSRPPPDRGVDRLAQPRHSRRLLMAFHSMIVLESITALSEAAVRDFTEFLLS